MGFFTDIIYEYGMLAMFFLILIEYACFPVSSEIILPFSGAVASLQGISFFVILPLSVIAGLIGTSICYFLGSYGGLHLLNKIQTRFPKTEQGINTSFEKFHKYGSMAVCLGRVIPLCRTYIGFVAGALKQSYSTYLVSSAIGITVWNILLIGTGYVLRNNWNLVGAYYEEYKIIIAPVLLFLVLVLLFKVTPLKRLIPKKKNTTT